MNRDVTSIQPFESMSNIRFSSPQPQLVRETPRQHESVKILERIISQQDHHRFKRFYSPSNEKLDLAMKLKLANESNSPKRLGERKKSDIVIIPTEDQYQKRTLMQQVNNI